MISISGKIRVMSEKMGLESPADGTRENKDFEMPPEGGIEVDRLSQIMEHIGETFTSERIAVPEGKIRSFLDAVGDINPIHFDANRVGESVFAEQSEGKILVPGFLTLALLSNGAAIYEALKIKEPYEVSLPAMEGTKWRAPIFADSNIVFKFTLKEANDCPIKTRDGVMTKWKVVAYAEVAGKMRPCMTTEATLV